MQLTPGTATAAVYTTGRLIRWQCNWSDFLAKHKDSYTVMRLSPRDAAVHLSEIAADSAQFHQEIGTLNLVFLMDVTYSMQDAIKQVTDKIQHEMLNQLLIR